MAQLCMGWAHPFLFLKTSEKNPGISNRELSKDKAFSFPGIFVGIKTFRGKNQLKPS